MQHLTKDEITRLLSVAKADNERNWLMMLVAYWHGLRASEVIGMRDSQVLDGYLTVKRLKGSLKTTQPLIESEDMLFNEKPALEARAAEGEGLLFPVSRIQFYRIVRHYGKLAGLPKHKAHPHVFKHSIAMHTIKDAGIENVRQYLGHKSISSTGQYLKVSDETAAKAIATAVGVS